MRFLLVWIVTIWCLGGFVWLAYFDKPKEGRSKAEHVVRSAAFVLVIWIVMCVLVWPG